MLKFTSLNKACPKYNFPLPKIDQVIDAMTGHGLLIFMDAYRGYNKSKIHVSDKKHTSFVTNQGIYSYKVMLSG